jgi:hypothetical protein
VTEKSLMNIESPLDSIKEVEIEERVGTERGVIPELTFGNTPRLVD